MSPDWWKWALGAGGVVLMAQGLSRSGPMDEKHAPMRAIIAAACRKYGVEFRAALAFAWLESRLNPEAKGDLQWAQWNDGERYRKNVLENPKLANNPFRETPEVWHSYGLFQLLAPYFVSGEEDPRILYNPVINADRGVRKIATSLKAAGGSLGGARIHYAGASKLPQATKDQLTSRLAGALRLIPVTAKA